MSYVPVTTRGTPLRRGDACVALWPQAALLEAGARQAGHPNSPLRKRKTASSRPGMMPQVHDGGGNGERERAIRGHAAPDGPAEFLRHRLRRGDAAGTGGGGPPAAGGGRG